MKTVNLILVLSCIILLSCSGADKNKTEKDTIVNSKTDWQFYNLTGKVKSVTETTRYILYEAGFEDQTGDTSGSKTIEFNKDGNVTSIISLGTDMVFLNEVKNEYNENKFTVKSEVYDEFGELKEFSKYEYDEKGFLVKKNNFNRDENLTDYTDFTNDGNGNALKQQQCRASDNHLMFTVTCKYDDNSRVSEVVYDNPDQGMYFKKSCYYDESGNLTGYENRDKEQLVQEVHKYEYEYDEFGNWISRTEYRDDRKTYFTKREIVYY